MCIIIGDIHQFICYCLTPLHSWQCILKYETLFSDLDNLCASSFFNVRLLILSDVATLQFKRFSSVCFLNYLIPLIFSTLISNSKIAPYPLCASSFESQNIIFISTIRTSLYPTSPSFPYVISY